MTDFSSFIFDLEFKFTVLTNFTMGAFFLKNSGSRAKQRNHLLTDENGKLLLEPLGFFQTSGKKDYKPANFVTIFSCFIYSNDKLHFLCLYLYQMLICQLPTRFLIIFYYIFSHFLCNFMFYVIL